MPKKAGKRSIEQMQFYSVVCEHVSEWDLENDAQVTLVYGFGSWGGPAGISSAVVLLHLTHVLTNASGSSQINAILVKIMPCVQELQ